MKTVKITPTIANEYVTRDVREHEEMARFPCEAGRHVIDDATADEMIKDAQHYTHQYGPDIPASLRRSYASLLAQLTA